MKLREQIILIVIDAGIRSVLMIRHIHKTKPTDDIKQLIKLINEMVDKQAEIIDAVNSLSIEQNDLKKKIRWLQ